MKLEEPDRTEKVLTGFKAAGMPEGLCGRVLDAAGAAWDAPVVQTPATGRWLKRMAIGLAAAIVFLVSAGAINHAMVAPWSVQSVVAAPAPAADTAMPDIPVTMPLGGAVAAPRPGAVREYFQNLNEYLVSPVPGVRPSAAVMDAAPLAYFCLIIMDKEA
ncbi:MAG: hypothetical protein ABIF71_00500 [Planctomycetota bacterium]